MSRSYRTGGEADVAVAAPAPTPAAPAAAAPAVEVGSNAVVGETVAAAPAEEAVATPVLSPLVAGPATAPNAPPVAAPVAGPEAPAAAPAQPRADIPEWAQGMHVARTLRMDTEGEDVRELQRRMNVPITGVYDKRTATAVRVWQGEHGLDADGVAGGDTLGMLGMRQQLRSEHHDEAKFIPKYRATAYSESNTYRTEADPYAVGAITKPRVRTVKGKRVTDDLGGKTYGVYQFESSVQVDGKNGDVENSTVARFMRDEANPYSAELKKIADAHGIGSEQWDAKWLELTARDNVGFGKAQEQFLERDKGDLVKTFMDKAKIPEAARKDPLLYDIVIGTTNQYGNLATGYAERLAAAQKRSKKPLTAEQIGLSLQNDKLNRVATNFAGSSEGARDGVRERIKRERALLVAPRPVLAPNATAPAATLPATTDPAKAPAAADPAKAPAPPKAVPVAEDLPGWADEPTSEVAKPLTPQERYPIKSELVQKGAEGTDARSIQALLVAAGSKVDVDGDFGRDTRAAVRAFQKKQGIAVDGVVGPETRARLYAAAKAAEVPAPPRRPTDLAKPAAPAPKPEAKPAAPVVAPPVVAPPVAAEAPKAEAPKADAPAKDAPVVDPAKDPDAVAAPKLSPEAAAARLTEIGQLTASKLGKGQLSRENQNTDSAKLVQRALVTLGYLPEGTEIDGKFGQNSTNALMAFQVANSGVDTIEKGVDKNGKPVYLTDKDRARLEGIVTGELDAGTRAKLLAALEAQKKSILTDGTLPEHHVVRKMGDTPEQKAAIEQKLRDQGFDPAKVMSVDTARYEKLGLRPHVLASAIDAWENAYASGAVKNTMITVNDFELPSNMKRSWTIDLSDLTETPFLHEVVAHGYGSQGPGEDRKWSTKFGKAQTDGSGQSVLGGMVAGARKYDGGKLHGATVDGLEKGINDRADPRLVRTHAPSDAKVDWKGEDVIGRELSYRSAGCIVWDAEAAKAYKKEAEKRGGLYQFNFAPNDAYWGKKNDVNRD